MTKVAFTPVTTRLIIYHFKQESLTIGASTKPFPPAAARPGPLFNGRPVEVLNLTVSSIKNTGQQLVGKVEAVNAAFYQKQRLI